jgi:hypothetical protein
MVSEGFSNYDTLPLRHPHRLSTGNLQRFAKLAPVFLCPIPPMPHPGIGGDRIDGYIRSDVIIVQIEEFANSVFLESHLKDIRAGNHPNRETVLRFSKNRSPASVAGHKQQNQEEAKINPVL